jgi:hypothetical protein
LSFYTKKKFFFCKNVGCVEWNGTKKGGDKYTSSYVFCVQISKKGQQKVKRGKSSSSSLPTAVNKQTAKEWRISSVFGLAPDFVKKFVDFSHRFH